MPKKKRKPPAPNKPAELPSPNVITANSFLRLLLENILKQVLFLTKCQIRCKKKKKNPVEVGQIRCVVQYKLRAEATEHMHPVLLLSLPPPFSPSPLSSLPPSLPVLPSLFSMPSRKTGAQRPERTEDPARRGA